MLRPALLLLLLALTPLASSQPALVRFPSSSTNVRYPFTLIVRNDAPTSRTLVLNGVTAKLAPVTPDLGHPSRARLSFTVDRVVLPPGHTRSLEFRLMTAAPRGVYALEPNLPGGSGSANPPGFNPVIDYPLAYAPGLNVPDRYRPGQQFLYLGNAPADYRYDERRLQNPAAYGRLFTLLGRRNDSSTFRVEGLPNTVSLRASSATAYPNLAPLLNDPHLSVAQRRYTSQQVWPYDGSKAACPPQDGAYSRPARSPRTPLRVHRLVRVAWPTGLGLGGWSGLGGYNAASPGDLMTATPVVVQYGSPQTSGDAAARTGEPKPCALETQLLADTWQLPLVLSLTPPPALPETDPSVGFKGWTRQQYAWLMGYPSATFGDREHLLALKRWQYANVPFPITVTFGRDGRVIAEDVPRLP